MKSRIDYPKDLDALVRIARRDGPTEQERRALVAASLTAASAGVGAATGLLGADRVATAAMKAGSRWLSVKGIAVVSLGLAGTASLGLWMAHRNVPRAGVAVPEVPAVAANAPPSLPSAPPAPFALSAAPSPFAPTAPTTTSASSAPTAPSTVLEGPAPSTTPIAVSHKPPTHPSAPPPQIASRSDAAGEANVIENARRALNKDPAGALRLVEQHRQQYPAGVLRPERDVVEIEALARLGRTREAEKKATAFRSRNPHSILEPRIRAALGEGAIPLPP